MPDRTECQVSNNATAQLYLELAALMNGALKLADGLQLSNVGNHLDYALNDLAKNDPFGLIKPPEFID